MRKAEFHYIILGVILYVYKDRPKQMAISYSVLAVLLNGFTATAAISSGFYRIGRICALLGQALSEGMEYFIGDGVSGIDAGIDRRQFFLEQYQWMMVFAIPIYVKILMENVACSVNTSFMYSIQRILCCCGCWRNFLFIDCKSICIFIIRKKGG